MFLKFDLKNPIGIITFLIPSLLTLKDVCRFKKVCTAIRDWCAMLIFDRKVPLYIPNDIKPVKDAISILQYMSSQRECNICNNKYMKGKYDISFGNNEINNYFLIDCKDEYGNWYIARIFKIQNGLVTVRFLFFHSKYNIILPLDSKNLAPYGTHTYIGIGSIFQIGQNVDVYDNISASWLRCRIVAIKDNMVKVHYWNFHDKFDEDILKKSKRIKPFYGSKGFLHEDNIVFRKKNIKCYMHGLFVSYVCIY